MDSNLLIVNNKATQDRFLPLFLNLPQRNIVFIGKETTFFHCQLYHGMLLSKTIHKPTVTMLHFSCTTHILIDSKANYATISPV